MVRSDAVLPKRYANRGLSELDDHAGQDEAIILCRKWLDEVKADGSPPSWGIFLAGDPGTGKTAIACALAHDAVRLGLDVDFITAPDLRYAFMRQMTLMDIIRKLERLKGDEPEIHEHRARSERIFAWRNTTHLMVFDDLGREQLSDSEWIQREIDNLIRHRGDRGLALVVTTNLSKRDRSARYGEPLESYLHEVCEFAKVEGEDLRRG